MSSIGDCFVILYPNSSEDSVIFGRNSLQDIENKGVAQEVHYYNNDETTNGEKAELQDVENCRMILQKSRPGIWGGDCGSNEKISIGVSWASPIAEESTDENYSVTDVIRLTLSTAMSAEQAVERIGQLVENHSHNEANFSLVICDSSTAWIIDCSGKLWAAQSLSEGFHRLPSNGLAIHTDIHKSSEHLSETLNRSDGETKLDFAVYCNAVGTVSENWCGDEPQGDKSFTLTDMFHTLRLAATNSKTRSSTVFAWKKNGISSHWFTATPCANESVFKPFIFSPNPIISPLTKVPPGDEITLLHKLHSQRKPSAIKYLKELETSCVEEVSRYLKENPSNNELDELMKDCVEAEVKFYR